MWLLRLMACLSALLSFACFGYAAFLYYVVLLYQLQMEQKMMDVFGPILLIACMSGLSAIIMALHDHDATTTLQRLQANKK